MFMDEVDNMRLKSGNGGHGRLNFRREKFISKGGPMVEMEAMGRM
jgi:GTPase involved in cell partitioning and DNA repair